MVKLPHFDMVIGQYSSMVSAGNRVTFPRKFSHELGKDLLLTKGLDGNLIIVAESEKQLLLEGIATKPFLPQSMRERQAFVMGNTFEIELDRLNRFVIPQPLYEYAEIADEVVFTGIGSFVQLWDSKKWRAYQEHLPEHIDHNLSGSE